MAQAAKNQPGNKRPGKNTAEFAKAKLDALVRSGGRYGVPTRVLRPDDLDMPHKLQPNRYEVHGRTGRVYLGDLTTREEEFLENSQDMLLRKNGADQKHRDILRQSLKSAWIQVTGFGGAFSVSLPPDTTPADKRGRDKYREKTLSLITLSHGDTSKDEWVNFLTGDDQSVSPAALPGTAAHWAVWVLEHEMAHSTGAGEAQADAMGSAQYIKTFGTDDIPRTISDIRAVNAVLRHANDEYSDRYGWQPVAALDALLEQGVGKISRLNNEKIREMRFERHDDQRDAVDSFAAALMHKQGSLLHKLGIKGLIHLTEEVLADTHIDKRQGAREIGNRFLLALRRLTGTPGLHAVMHKRRKKQSPGNTPT